MDFGATYLNLLHLLFFLMYLFFMVIKITLFHTVYTVWRVFNISLVQLFIEALWCLHWVKYSKSGLHVCIYALSIFYMLCIILFTCLQNSVWHVWFSWKLQNKYIWFEQYLAAKHELLACSHAFRGYEKISFPSPLCSKRVLGIWLPNQMATWPRACSISPSRMT